MLVNVLLIIVGMFLDSTTAILVIAPIIAKPLVAAGVDPVHLGMVVVFNLMIGLLTPPIGALLFVEAKIADLPFGDLVQAIWPFTLALIGVLFLITYVPGLVMWLPNLVFG